MLQLRIKTIVGEEKTVDIDPGETVNDLKQKLEELFQEYPRAQQRLVYEGKFIKNERTINFYQMKNGALVNLVKALRSA